MARKKSTPTTPTPPPSVGAAEPPTLDFTQIPHGGAPLSYFTFHEFILPDGRDASAHPETVNAGYALSLYESILWALHRGTDFDALREGSTLTQRRA